MLTGICTRVSCRPRRRHARVISPRLAPYLLQCRGSRLCGRCGRRGAGSDAAADGKRLCQASGTQRTLQRPGPNVGQAAEAPAPGSHTAAHLVVMMALMSTPSGLKGCSRVRMMSLPGSVVE